MKIIKKIGFIIIIIAICNCFFLIDSNAAGGGSSPSGSSIISAASNFIGTGSNQANGVTTTGVTSVLSFAASVVATIGMFILVIATLILGIQYLTANPQRQAGLRAQMVGLLWASVVVFGAYGIWNLLVTIVASF